ncbi:MAG TPA: FdhF/YdeP family oxidoreductase [Thermoanaerobaculia bacterium]|nr:FdhF/YdeP family oxidoreductase [Thermoanaerobaculia bacterium]
MAIRPSLWASLSPTGAGETKPAHYRDMARVAWENRDALGYAWRLLRDGTCDGCALGTSGMRDWTIPGTHLCMVRLELLRLNTAPPLDPERLRDAGSLEPLSGRELRALGRLPEPMLRRAGERGFRVVSWEEALDAAAEKIRASDPRRVAVYLTSRGILNEHYYAAQKAARFMGTSHIDNSARLCHSASTSAMKKTLGYGATTCSYADWIGSDLVVFFGSNAANNQPVSMKYLDRARRRGTRVAVVNPYEEPGMKRYWVPSLPESALFGTRIADDWYAVRTGGDLAFLAGVFKILCAEGWIDRDFVARRTEGFGPARASVEALAFDRLEADSGLSRGEMRRFAETLRDAKNAVFVWSMGLTQHAHGTPTIEALVNVALARHYVGREKTGLMPIRGHSGVQGGAEVGCVPALPEAASRRFAEIWGFPLPDFEGLSAAEQVEASRRGEIDVFWIVGGNFLETLPEPRRSREALERVGTRIHQDIVLSSQMLVPPRDTVVLFPATTRYESPGGGTETSTERRIIFSPEIPGPRVSGARPEWQVFADVARRVRPDFADRLRIESSAQLRQEIGRAIPLYAGIENLRRKGDSFQWGGARLFSDGVFATADGKARFSEISLGDARAAGDIFMVSTRRGKQFNSMIQHDVDPLNGARRLDVLISAGDASRLGIADGEPVRLTSDTGRFEGFAKVAPIREGDLQVHWPEAGGLLAGGRLDPISLEPDYTAAVTLSKIPVSPGGGRPTS